MLKRQNPDHVQYCICQVITAFYKANGPVIDRERDPYQFATHPSVKHIVDACPAVLDRDNWVYHGPDGIDELSWELIRASRIRRVWITEKRPFVEHLRFEESIRYKEIPEFSPLESRIAKVCLPEIEGEPYRRIVRALYRTNSSTAYCIGILEDALSSGYGRKRDVCIDGGVATINIEYCENEEEVDIDRMREEFPQFSEIVINGTHEAVGGE
jgi:hypothetical protein